MGHGFEKLPEKERMDILRGVGAELPVPAGQDHQRIRDGHGDAEDQSGAINDGFGELSQAEQFEQSQADQLMDTEQ